ncbi:AraC family transcriptional regulator [Leptothrix sp. BB-4]
MGSSRHKSTAKSRPTPTPKLTPEFEHDLNRDPRLGYEPPDAGDFVRCFEHGSPTPLERWHCHDEYELQLIVGARGRAFVGDHVGHFEPGHLVLCGLRLPHNWISTDLPPSGLSVRSLVIQFREEPLRAGMQAFRELEELGPLLERARRGIEFLGQSERVLERFHRIRASRGLARFAEFIGLMCQLRRCEDYRLLSSENVVGLTPGSTRSTINKVVEYVNENHAQELSVAEVAARFHMSESGFSRWFSRATESTFTAFVNRVRVHQACELLMHSDQQVSSICWAVGFNNLANFNRRFRDVKGVTPTEYRRLSLLRLKGGGSPTDGSTPTTGAST